MNDTGTLLTGYYRANSAIFQDAAAFKLDQDANLLWSRKFSTISGSNLIFNHSVALADANILLAGKQQNPLNTGDDVIVLVNIDPKGNINWSKGYQITLVAGTEGNIEITSITEGLAGELIISGSMALDGSGEPRSFLAKTDVVGNLLFSKLFSVPPGASDVFTNAFVQNGFIEIFGVSENIQCQDVDTRSMYTMRLDYLDGSIVFLNRYCFSPFGGPISYGWIPHNFKAARTDYGYSFCGDLLENGTDRNILAAAFDSNLNYVESIAVKNFNSNSYHHSNVSREGFINFFQRETTVQQLYFTSLNSDGSIRRQRKLNFPATKFENLIFDGGQRIAFKPNAVFFVVNYNDPAGRNVVECSQLTDNDTASVVCLGTDTSFSTAQPFQVYFSNNQSYNVVDGVLSDVTISLAALDISLLEENVCEQVVVCNTIKISGPDTVCVIGQNTQFTAHLNPDCKSKIVWDLDTASFWNIDQVNDTCLNVIFKSPGYGVFEKTIYAYAGSCATVVDSLKIKLFSIPKPLPGDTTLCEGDSLKLTIGHWFKDYLWQNGTADSGLTIKEPGTYWVTVEAYCGYFFADTIRVFSKSLPSNFIYHDTAICQNGSLVLQPYRQYASYLWSDGSNGSQLGINQSGTYTLQVSDEYGCKSTEAIVVRPKACLQYVHFPNAFTPDGNGINDVFRPVKTMELVQYELSVFNRWGQNVFTSESPLRGWDGTFNGKLQNSGTFAWVCRYRIEGGELKTLKGTVMLIRQ